MNLTNDHVSKQSETIESRLRLKYEFPTLRLVHTYEVRPRKDKRGADLISDALPLGRLCFTGSR